MKYNIIFIPKGSFSASNEEAAKKRKEIRESLLKGNSVVSTNGELKNPKNVSKDEEVIKVPKGKLANFYWYENDIDLFEAEKQAMKKYFPQFKLNKLDDGRLYWIGTFRNIIGDGSEWTLQAIYDNDHPSAERWGGSVKIYSIEPNMEEISKKLDEPIPHILKDTDGYIYLCTARKTDIQAGNTVTTVAASLSWAIKWIGAFELLMAGDLSTEEFRNHLI